ncbi:response regulator [Rhodopseudomonas palustris]|uniref:response regulator n=1 Tax=Rhodopseudomonas palustris TaxID=1076 RepID=UPI000164A209|nr:response regulator [Rhodopseudomonas palustris]ACF03504.1 response regulator receiver protein [Rhodopseudomonas palustris TIE-1]PPQ42019.1 response regulator [Rhodopseudomonas palustris]QLH73464.1 response regulator transcription factor [Rhodopseudomonas palustris]RIA02869.1 response regulator [Rhodopseudomonas palustris]WBU29613.1 response regulator [Rhodopseudomonas palustris]
MEVLVVDDEPAVRTVLTLVLGKAGHQVTVCDSGAGALDWLSCSDPALALIDLSLPKVQDKSVLAAVRAARPALPIIVISGMLPEFDAAMLKREGMTVENGVYCLAKPFTAKQLQKLMDAALAQGGPAPG